jgi:hypothetical protein
MTRKTVTMNVQCTIAPWAPVFIACMLRLSTTERSKVTMATFVIDHGVKVKP